MHPWTLSTDHKRMGWTLLIIRIAAGIVFLYHGSAILFGAFHGPGIHGFAAYTHLPVAVAFLVGLAQFCGGLAFITGILTRLGAAGIVAVMLGAIFMVHIKNGFDVTKGGMEYALTQLLIATALLFTGAGPYSLYYLLWPAAKSTPTGTQPTQIPQV